MAFSWMNVDTSFLKEVIRASDVPNANLYVRSDDKDAVVSCMNTICDFPDKKFVMRYRAIIEQYLLVGYRDEINRICRQLNIGGANFNERQAAMTKKALSASMIHAYIAAILHISGMDVRESDYSSFRYTRSLNMKDTVVEDVPLYDFQREAVDKLREHFIEKDEKDGLLVMPTGSGKSRTASYFLIREMIGRGYQIIWLAHRYMLLDQAADCFLRFAGLSKIENPKIRDYRISCISGEHMRLSQIDRHEVVIASVASVCRNKDHLRRILGKKVMIVVDEAHHTLAPTYQDTIRFIRKNRRDTKLLGLTATPVRASDKASKELLELYGNHIVYSISMSNLIAKGILAAPEFIRRETGEDFEPLISIDEERFIRKYGELPEELVNKIASSNARNKIIIREFLDNREKYGKTLIFAMNILHCRFLYEELKKQGIRCGYIHSGKEDNTSVIRDFRENQLDVLINVNIMTEGTDVPDIQTVFLTRPTASEGLLMQMIGRGMRGISAGGTEKVNIVDFHDIWDTFNRWLNPRWVMDDEITEESEQPERRKSGSVYRKYEWKMCQEIYRSLVFKNAAIGRNVMLPVGWYSLIDEDGEIERMLVFEGQMEGLLAMMRDKPNWKEDGSFQAETALRRYFNNFSERPSLHELGLLIDNVRNNEEQPSLFILENRKKADPYYVAKRAMEENRDPILLAEEIYETYDLARDLFGSKMEYVMKVCELGVRLRYGGEREIGQRVEELPEELLVFDRTPVYDLDELVREVKDEMFGGSYEGLGVIRWTDKAYKTFYGRYWRDTHDIEINSVLNSRDVPREVVKYVLYHEMLHRDIFSHNTEFRIREHCYPQYEEWDHFLDDNMGRFDIKEW